MNHKHQTDNASIESSSCLKLPPSILEKGKTREELPGFFESASNSRLVEHVIRARNLAGRSGGEVLDAVARRKGGRGVQRTDRQRTLQTTAHVGLDVGCRRSGRGVGFVFQSPFLLRTVDLTEVIDTGILLRRGAGVHEVGDRDGGQQTDDGHDDHDLNQREALLCEFVEFHTF